MTERFSHADMALELRKLAVGKREWLRTFMAKRPAHEITVRTRELAVLEQAAEMFERAARRDAA